MAEIDLQTDTVTLRRPDDWHVHLRDGAMLEGVVNYTARQFARAIVMPNLMPAITTAKAAQSYRARIIAALPQGCDFTPLMTCYLTDNTDAQALADGHAQGIFTAAKLYPAGATTNSDSGVSNIARIMPVLERMAEIGMPLCVHGEVTDAQIDIFDREKVFIDQVLMPLIYALPQLKVVFEHITTADAVAFVDQAGPTIAATITPQHLQINRNAMLVGGMHPHAYCLPVAKREHHRLALRKAATSGSSKYFLGTDSAPHARSAKENACGCAGIFNAPYAMESYAGVFDEENALERLEGFASIHGPNFYGLPLNAGTITLRRARIDVPGVIPLADTQIVPFHAGAQIGWELV